MDSNRKIRETHKPDVSPAQGPERVDLVHLGHVQQLVHVLRADLLQCALAPVAELNKCSACLGKKRESVFVCVCVCVCVRLRWIIGLQ